MDSSALDSLDDDLPDDGAELIARLQAIVGVCCASCRRPMCLHQVLASIALGLGAGPRCLECMATRLEQTPGALAESLFGYFQGRACYWAAWKWASQQEQVGSSAIPACFTNSEKAAL
jgi:hypothetical protein